MEKIRPVDKQLAYQIDKLLKATAAAEAAEAADGGGAPADGDDDAADILRFKPNLEGLQEARGGGGEDGARQISFSFVGFVAFGPLYCI